MKNNISIAYFSMEIGLESAIPTYSGGLGLLAGDTLRSAVGAMRELFNRQIPDWREDKSRLII